MTCTPDCAALGEKLDALETAVRGNADATKDVLLILDSMRRIFDEVLAIKKAEAGQEKGVTA